ncbi:MAG: sugar transferase [Alkalinema sp. RU_4_3]|nr:sugar transferase [Alkalinema sp. RU_4_3]
MLSSYKLRWRKRFLVVKKAEAGQKTALCLDRGRLYDCVQHTPARAIKLDLDLDYDSLLIWAEAGLAAGKTVYVSLPAALNLPQSLSARQWGIKRLLDRLAALVLAVPLAIPALVVALLIKRTTQESLLVREWHLGERGRLFQTIHFRIRDRHGNWLRYGEWMHRFKLDRLPKLLNVLRGEMSLVGACPSRLCNAAQTDRTLRYRFNALPGLTGAWQFEQVSRLDAVFLNGLDLNYLRHWSLSRDVQMLVMTLVFLATLQSKDSVA